MASEAHVIDITVQTHDKVGPGLEKARSSLRNFDKAVERTQARLSRFARTDYDVAIRAIDKVTPAGSRIRATLHGITGHTYNATVAAIDKTAAKVQEARARLVALTGKVWTVTLAAKNTISQKASGAVSGAFQNLTGMGAQMAAGAGIGYGVYDTIKTYMDFEAQMKKVQAISGASGAEFDALTAKAKEMGATTQFSATEAGQALEYMAMAGWKTDDMLSGISGIMDLAAASGEDLGKVSDIVTDALTAFGLKASDSAHFADVLAAASSNSNTNVSMMGETFKYVAPIAGALGYSAEDTAVAIGLMANAGIKGSDAGTALRATMTRLVDPPKEAAQAMEALGISVRNSDGTMKPFMQTMRELRERFGGLSQAEKAQMASSIAGQEAMSGFLAIVNASDSDFDKLTGAIYNADGAAAQMAATMNDNLKGDLKALSSVWEAFQLELMSGKGGDGIRSFVQGVKTDLEKFTGYIKDGFDISDVGRLALDILTQLKNKFLEFDGIGSILAGGALAVGLLKIISLARRATAAIKRVSGAGGPGGGVGGTASEAASAVKSMVVNATSVVVNGKGVSGGGAAGSAAETAGEVASGTGGAPGEKGGGNGPKGKGGRLGGWGKWLGRGAAAATAIVGAYDAYSTYQDNQQKTEEAQYAVESGAQDESYLAETERQNTDRLGGSIGSTGGALAGGLVGAKAGAAAGGAIGSLFGGVGAAPGAAIGGVIGGIGGGIAGSELGQDIGGNIAEISQSAGQMWDGIKAGAADAWQSVATSAGTAWDGIKASAGETATWLGNSASQAWDAVSQGASSVATDVGSVLSGIADTAGQEWQQISESAGQAWDSITAEAGSIAQPIIDGLIDVVNFVVGLAVLVWAQIEPYFDAGAAYIAGIWDSISETASEIWNGIVSTVSEVWASIADTVSQAWEAVNEAIAEAWAEITETIGTAAEAVAEVAGEAWSAITETADEAWAAVSEAASEAWTWITDAASAAWDTICSIFSAAADWFMSTVWQPISDFASAAWAAITATINAAWDFVCGIWGAASSWFEGSVWAPISSAVSSVQSAISNAFQAAYNAVTGIFSGLANWFDTNVVSPIKAKFASIRDLGASITGLGGSHHAAGGIFNVPHQALVAENGPEAIIPLNDRNRGTDLLQKAAEFMGLNLPELTAPDIKAPELEVPELSMPGLNLPELTAPGTRSNGEEDAGEGQAIPANAAQESAGGPVSVALSLGGITIPITIEGGSTSPQDIAAAIRNQLEDIADDIGGQLATKVADIFSNSPVMNAT